MRVPGTKIYRAFEELDRFSDEQCARFLAAALRPGRRIARLTLSLLVGVALLGIAIPLMFILTEFPTRFVPKITDFWIWTFLFFVTTALVTVCVVAATLFRDLMLRRRLRRLINTRGSCTSCGYGLLGLLVSDANTVVCPECGHSSEVDPALGELAIGGDGKRVFQSSRAAETPVFWTPIRRLRLGRLFRVTGWLALSSVFLVLAGVAWRLMVVSADARRAKALLNPDLVLVQHIASMRAAIGAGKDVAFAVRPDDINAAEVIVRLGDDIDRLFANPFPPITFGAPQRGPQPPLLLSLLGQTFKAKQAYEDVNTQENQFNASKAFAETVMRRLEETGLIARLDELTSFRRVELGIFQPFGRFGGFYSELPGNPVWAIIRANKGRMRLAIATGRSEEAIRAFESGMALARFMRFGIGTPRDAWEQVMLDEIRPLLRITDDAGLRRITEAITRAADAPGIMDSLEARRLERKQFIYDHFSDDAATRWGVYSVSAAAGMPFDVSQWWKAKPLGRLDDNLLEIDETIAIAKRLSAQLPYVRSATMDAMPPRRGYYLLNPEWEHDEYCGWRLRSNDVRLGRRSGALTMIALERYRLAYGVHPSRLDQLVPQFLESVPLDPWSGQPLRYRAGLVPGTEPAGYILYSIGMDMKDDGGVDGGSYTLTASSLMYNPTKGTYEPNVTGGDFIFNADSDFPGRDWNW